MDSFGLGFRISIEICRTADILPRFLVIRRWFGSRDVLSGPLNFISEVRENVFLWFYALVARRSFTNPVAPDLSFTVVNH